MPQHYWLFLHTTHAVVFVGFLQVMSHMAAAQSASVVFLCVHRENYDFLEALAPQLSGKVPPSDAREHAYVLTFRTNRAVFINLEGAGGC